MPARGIDRVEDSHADAWFRHGIGRIQGSRTGAWLLSLAAWLSTSAFGSIELVNRILGRVIDRS